MTRLQRAELYLALVLTLVLAFAFANLRVPVASAAASDSCPQVPTISSLQTCVTHAASVELITNQGVAKSLLAKLGASQAALDRGQPDVAANIVRAFMLETQAQRGKYIDTEQADHMLMHAAMVIQALGSSR